MQTGEGCADDDALARSCRRGHSVETAILNIGSNLNSARRHSDASRATNNCERIMATDCKPVLKPPFLLPLLLARTSKCAMMEHPRSEGGRTDGRANGRRAVARGGLKGREREGRKSVAEKKGWNGGGEGCNVPTTQWFSFHSKCGALST